MAMPFVQGDVPPGWMPVPRTISRLRSAILRAREARAHRRARSQLRDLPADVLQDIGLMGKELKRLRLDDASGRFPFARSDI
jgi:hypothetical protein